MFRNDKHDLTNQEFIAVATHSYSVLERAIRAATGTSAAEPLSAQAHGLLAATWSVVHGFAHLALAGQLRAKGQGGSSRDAILSTLLPQMLEHLPWMSGGATP
jgi:hypothetical protein